MAKLLRHRTEKGHGNGPVWNRWQLQRRDYILSPLARPLDCTTAKQKHDSCTPSIGRAEWTV